MPLLLLQPHVSWCLLQHHPASAWLPALPLQGREGRVVRLWHHHLLQHLHLLQAL
jgi:hypothetical protein